MGRALLLGCLVFVGCERPCSVAGAYAIDTCSRLTDPQTCDVARGFCVEPKDCTTNADCPDHYVCHKGVGREGEVLKGVVGCVRSCIGTSEAEANEPDSLCQPGYVCNTTTRQCVLDTGRTCRPGGFVECNGGNCGPAGTCVAPRFCATNADCPGGALCEMNSGTCFESCSVTLQCKGSAVCDPATKQCG